MCHGCGLSWLTTRITVGVKIPGAAGQLCGPEQIFRNCFLQHPKQPLQGSHTASWPAATEPFLPSQIPQLASLQLSATDEEKKILQNTQICSGARTYLDQVKPLSGWKPGLKVGGYSNNFWEITGSDCTNILHCNLGRWVGDSHQVCLGTGPFWIQFQATKISKVINSQTPTAFGEPSKQKFGLKKRGEPIELIQVATEAPHLNIYQLSHQQGRTRMALTGERH